MVELNSTGKESSSAFGCESTSIESSVGPWALESDEPGTFMLRRWMEEASEMLAVTFYSSSTVARFLVKVH